MTTAPAPAPAVRLRTMTRLGVATAVVIAIDQAIKVATAHAPDSRWLYPLHNHGLSLGVVTTSRWAETLAMAIGLIAAAALLIRAVRRGRVKPLPVALLLGGAASNLIDRAVLGSVRDMFPLAHLMVINPADVAVLAGVLLLGTTAVRHTRTGTPGLAPRRTRGTSTSPSEST